MSELCAHKFLRRVKNSSLRVTHMSQWLFWTFGKHISSRSTRYVSVTAQRLRVISRGVPVTVNIYKPDRLDDATTHPRRRPGSSPFFPITHLCVGRPRSRIRRLFLRPRRLETKMTRSPHAMKRGETFCKETLSPLSRCLFLNSYELRLTIKYIQVYIGYYWCTRSCF